MAKTNTRYEVFHRRMRAALEACECAECETRRDVLRSLRTRLDAEHAARLAEIAAHMETRERLAEAMALLRRVEWDAAGYCSECDNHQTDDGEHAPDCALFALLEKKGERI